MSFKYKLPGENLQVMECETDLMHWSSLGLMVLEKAN